MRSQRLVVDEIALGSPLDLWNAAQPEGLQVRYGDRLERLNGVRVRSSPAEAMTRKEASLRCIYIYANIIIYIYIYCIFISYIIYIYISISYMTYILVYHDLFTD